MKNESQRSRTSRDGGIRERAGLIYELDLRKRWGATCVCWRHKKGGKRNLKANKERDSQSGTGGCSGLRLDPEDTETANRYTPKNAKNVAAAVGESK